MIVFSHDRRRNGIPSIVACVVRMSEEAAEEARQTDKASREVRLANLRRAAAERRPLFGR